MVLVGPPGAGKSTVGGCCPIGSGWTSPTSMTSSSPGQIAAFRPRALATVDVATGEAAVAINQRSDVCAVPAAGVVAEALVLADAALEKFGSDALPDTDVNGASMVNRNVETDLQRALGAELAARRTARKMIQAHLAKRSATPGSGAS